MFKCMCWSASHSRMSVCVCHRVIFKMSYMVTEAKLILWCEKLWHKENNSLEEDYQLIITSSMRCIGEETRSNAIWKVVVLTYF